MMKKITKIMAFLYLLVIFSGCAPTIVKTTRLIPGPDLPKTQPIKVFKIGEPVSGKYEILGVVSGFYTPPHGKPEKTLEYLKSEASLMGADALIGYYNNFGVAGKFWSSALAARLVAEGQNMTKPTRSFMVVIPKAFFSDDVDSEGRTDKIDSAARNVAQLSLTEKGFYAIKIEELAPDSFEASFQGMDDTELNKYGGQQSDFILVTRFLTSSYATIILSSGESISLETALYSKSQKQVTWQNSATGTASTGWIVNMVDSDMKIMMATDAAMRHALKTLPDITTTSKKK